MTDVAKQQTIIKMRQENIGRLFQRAARAYSERALTKLAARGHSGLTLFHTMLIANLDVSGTQLSVLAERAGVTKQAMGQAANELEARDYITRIPDPQDKRAVLIQFTALGERFLEAAYEVKLEIEAEYAEVLGEQNLKVLFGLLTMLVDGEVRKEDTLSM